MTKYNLAVFDEMKNRKKVTEIENINLKQIKDLSFRIDQYMDKNAPGQTELKVCTIALWKPGNWRGIYRYAPTVFVEILLRYNLDDHNPGRLLKR